MTGLRPLALVTGGLHRVGAAIAARLAAAGYDLALHRRSEGAPDDALADALAATGAAARIFSADLGEAGAAESLFETVGTAFGRPPALLINNAALFAEGAIADVDRARLDAALGVNLTAPVLLTQAMAMAHGGAASGATGGCVVNIIDQRVRNPVPDQIAYSIAKQALWQATRTLAVACAPSVRVNAVAPGLTLPTDTYEPGRMDRMAQHMPLARLARPDDIADAVLFLAQAAAVTGQTIFVDGGANLTGFPRDFAYL